MPIAITNSHLESSSLLFFINAVPAVGDVLVKGMLGIDGKSFAGIGFRFCFPFCYSYIFAGKWRSQKKGGNVTGALIVEKVRRK